MSCDLDPVNMCCWTHGTDIDMDDYCEGYCWLGYIDYEDEDLDEDDEYCPYCEGLDTLPEHCTCGFVEAVK